MEPVQTCFERGAVVDERASVLRAPNSPRQTSTLAALGPAAAAREGHPNRAAERPRGQVAADGCTWIPGADSAMPRAPTLAAIPAVLISRAASVPILLRAESAAARAPEGPSRPDRRWGCSPQTAENRKNLKNARETWRRRGDGGEGAGAAVTCGAPAAARGGGADRAVWSSRPAEPRRGRRTQRPKTKQRFVPMRSCQLMMSRHSRNRSEAC